LTRPGYLAGSIGGEESAEERERVRHAVDAEMARLNPEVDVSVLFRGGSAAG
jgi:hypothetical protein